jgi:uncharacterized protein YndB with AHSA1/START domain
MSDQFLAGDQRPTVRLERRYPHPVAKVWRAVSEPEHLSRWFPMPVEIDLRPGGELRFGGTGRAPDSTGTVRLVEAPHRLEFTWGTDLLSVELRPDRGGTTLVLTHSFDDHYGAASFAAGWGACLAGLRHLLAGEPLPTPDRVILRHEELVHEFGLDRPVVTETDDGWTVRVERQLTCPAEVAWDLWFGRDLTTGEQRTAPAVGEPLTPYMAPDKEIGRMTEVSLHRALAFDVGPQGGPGHHVRVELADGTGHGARVVLTVRGTDPAERDAAVQMWGTGAVGHLAASAAEWALAQPPAA